MRGPVLTLLASLVCLILLSWVASRTVGPKLHERSDGLGQINLEHKKRSVMANFPGIDPDWKKEIPQFLAPVVEVNPQGGIVSARTKVALSSDNEAKIRYTRDGSIPDRHSELYSGPIEVDSTVVIRARTFVNGKFPGDIATQTFVVDSQHELPILAISTDPENLWNKYSGIYENFGRRGKAWRRKAVVEFIPADGSGRLDFVADLRIHGGWSRQLPKKSFHLYYDRGALSGGVNSDVLSAPGIVAEREVVVRSGGHAPNVRLNDVLFHDTFQDLGHPVDAVETVALYINGSYFGAYNLRESRNADYAQRHYGFEDPDILVVANCWLGKFTYFYACYETVAGDDNDWLSLIRFFNDADLSENAAFEQAESRIDLDSFTDYWILNVFVSNRDWPETNAYLMRNRTGDDVRWRWVPWDADQSFISFKNGEIGRNTLARTTTEQEPPAKPWKPMPGSSVSDIHTSNWKGTLLPRKLLENDGYRDRFVLRYADLLNTEFTTDAMNARLDKWSDIYSSEVGRDLERWEQPDTLFSNVGQLIRRFNEERPSYAWQHLKERFNLSEPVDVDVSINASNAGSVRLNSIVIGEFPFSGRYFPGSTISVQADPSPGFRFVDWTIDGKRVEALVARVTIVDGQSVSIRANFVRSRQG